MNGVRLSPSAAERRLGNFCRPLIVLNDDPAHPYSFRGSSVLLEHKGNFLCIATRHQIDKIDPEIIGIYIDGAQRIITASSFNYISYNDKNNERYEEDICIFSFLKSEYDVPNFKSYFFRFEEKLWEEMRAAHLIAYGYPYEFREVDYGVPRVHERQIMMGGRYEHRVGASNLHLAHFEAGLEFDADGLSGGPIFRISGNADGFVVELAGVILHGGRKSTAIRFLGADFIGRLVGRL